MAALLVTLVVTRCSFASIPSMAETDETYRLHAHSRLVVVQLMDDTDNHDELYFEKEYLLSRCEKPFEISAPAVFVEDSIGGTGVALFRKAPLPHARADQSPDYRVEPAQGVVAVLSNSYQCVKIPYRGGRYGRIRAATDFHRRFRPYKAGRDGLSLSNTWGDGNRDARINERFLMREVEAGAELGVDVIQVDDGWQKGRSANSAALAKGEKGRWGAWWDIDGFWDVDPARLRMEVLNPERMPELYPDDDPLAPSRWPRDAIFAISMLSSPLGWFEIQNLSEETVSSWRPLVTRWKRERDAIHDGYVYPVGARPDGVSWTGFVSVARDGSEGTALLFRELAETGDFALDVSDLLPHQCADVAVIGGRGTASPSDGMLKVAVPEKLDFIWLKIRRRN